MRSFCATWTILCSRSYTWEQPTISTKKNTWNTSRNGNTILQSSPWSIDSDSVVVLSRFYIWSLVSTMNQEKTFVPNPKSFLVDLLILERRRERNECRWEHPPRPDIVLSTMVPLETVSMTESLSVFWMTVRIRIWYLWLDTRGIIERMGRCRSVLWF